MFPKIFLGGNQAQKSREILFLGVLLFLCFLGGQHRQIFGDFLSKNIFLPFFKNFGAKNIFGDSSKMQFLAKNLTI